MRTTSPRRVLLHLVGTGDNPSLTSGFLRKACALGFAGIAPIYENENDARSTCGNDTGCYERMRREILFLAYNHHDDSIAVYGQVLDNLDAVGAGAESCAFQSVSATYPATCRRVRNPTAGCGGFQAHASMVVRMFGSATHACAIPGQLSSNEATWEFLLTTPLP